MNCVYSFHVSINLFKSLCRDDIERAVKKLKVLGKGFEILNIGSTKILQTVPCELNTDHTAVMALAQV
jgi:ESCRT-II complex subunit VPS22